MKQRSGFGVMARLISLVKPLTGWMLLAVFSGTLGHLAASFITIFGAYALALAAGFKVPFSMGALFALVIICAAARGFLRYAEQECNHYIAFKLLALIRDKVFGALRKLCPAKLEGRDKGDLISVITADIELLEVFYAHTISPAAIAALYGIVMVLFIGHFSWILGLYTLAAHLLVGVLLPWCFSRQNGDLGLKFRQQAGALSAFVLDSVRGLSETLQYGRGQERLAEMKKRTDELSSHEAKLKALASDNAAVSNTLILLLDFGMLFLSAFLFKNGSLSWDALLIATLALFSSFGPVIALAALGSGLQQTFASGNRVLDILDETPIAEEVTGKPEMTFEGAEAKDLTFSYDDEVILDHLSLEIPKGSVIGLVGKSGSGKSTLLKLLMRFWPAEKGALRISGTDVGEINTKNLREMESYVTQDAHLFRDTIRNNLRIAKSDATDAEIEAACRKASVHDFIMSLPQGYDTQVGELGDTLSGGEQQRIGLARAFLHDAPFILLDEPTSNLDSLNEAVILKSLSEAREDKTVLLVSHRKSTMRIADVVYSVENGRMS